MSPSVPIRAILLVVILSASVSAASADGFGRPDGGTPIPAAAAPDHAFVMPKPIRLVFGDVLAAQRALNTELRTELGQVKTGTSWRPAAVIVLISFLYGVLHAIGPGHGKFVVGGYLLTRRARIVHGLAMSGSAALVQALSAIAWVGGLVVILRISASQVLSHAGVIEMASYGLIAAVGLSMLWNLATKRVCCDLAHAPGHDHDHDHGHDHHDTDAAHPRTELREWLKILGTGAAVGLRPCSGAILVLLFTLANAIFPVGILAALAMGVGVAITVSVVSLTSLGAQRLVPILAGGGAAGRARISRVIAYGGASLITIFGLSQIAALWSGMLMPAFG